MTLEETKEEMWSWATDLFPICRSLTGDGVRYTLAYIKRHLPSLKIYEVPTGTKAFDWHVPYEWDIKNAWIKDPSGQKIVDFKNNNLHLVGYSEPVNSVISLEELQKHLYSLPDQPTAIPYVTSYYSRNWGFCLTHQDRLKLKDGKYRVYIDSELKKGVLNYGEIIIPGTSKEEVFLSTYICHPSMANNEVSGPVVTTALVKWLLQSSRKYTYRIIFIPETIGSIIYLSRNLKELKDNVIAGFNVTCVGDNNEYSYLPSRRGDTLSDRVALHALKHHAGTFKKYTWLDRGSDERQYCAPGVDLPIASIMRSKYGEYPQYHTSLDSLNFISPEGLAGALEILKKAIEAIEENCLLHTKILGEPQLGKRGLYPSVSKKNCSKSVQTILNLLTYADGEHDLLEVAEKINVPVWELIALTMKLKKSGILLNNENI